MFSNRPQHHVFDQRVANSHRAAIESSLNDLLQDSPRESFMSSTPSFGSASSGGSSNALPSYAVGAYEEFFPEPQVYDDNIYQVQFKFNFRYCANLSGHRLRIGDFCILDCTHDQIDMGVVCGQYTSEEFLRNRLVLGDLVDKEDSKIANIIRTATDEELTFLPIKHEQELKLLAVCQHLALSRFMLPMNIYGVEFQFDGKKVSIFYTSETRVDYKALVKEVFNSCQTHIWMRKISRNVKFVPKPYAIEALITGQKLYY